MTRRRGFTLVEMLAVFVIMGLIMSFAIPKFGNIRSQNNMRSAKDQLAIALATARAAAIQKGRQAQFRISGNSISVRADTNVSGAGMVLLAPVSLSSNFNVTITVRSAADTLVPFDARGFANTASGQTARYVLVGGARTDSICVSRFGVIMKVGCAL